MHTNAPSATTITSAFHEQENKLMVEIRLGKAGIYDCSIDLDSHLHETFGKPLTLPEDLEEKLSEDWAIESEKDILNFLRKLTGKSYFRAQRDNTCNYETDFDRFFVYTVYSPEGVSDWAWADNCFVTIEIGDPGDPRYVSYSPAQIYQLKDECIGDTSFLTWRLSWRADPIGCGFKGSSEEELESLNERFSYGYSHSPTSEVIDSCYGDPIWSGDMPNEMREGYIARIKGSSRPVIITPYHP